MVKGNHDFKAMGPLLLNNLRCTPWTVHHQTLEIESNWWFLRHCNRGCSCWVLRLSPITSNSFPQIRPVWEAYIYICFFHCMLKIPYDLPSSSIQSVDVLNTFKYTSIDKHVLSITTVFFVCLPSTSKQCSTDLCFSFKLIQSLALFILGCKARPRHQDQGNPTVNPVVRNSDQGYGLNRTMAVPTWEFCPWLQGYFSSPFHKSVRMGQTLGFVGWKW